MNDFVLGASKGGTRKLMKWAKFLGFWQVDNEMSSWALPRTSWILLTAISLKDTFVAALPCGGYPLATRISGFFFFVISHGFLFFKAFYLMKWNCSWSRNLTILHSLARREAMRDWTQKKNFTKTRSLMRSPFQSCVHSYHIGRCYLWNRMNYISSNVSSRSLRYQYMLWDWWMTGFNVTFAVHKVQWTCRTQAMRWQAFMMQDEASKWHSSNY